MRIKWLHLSDIHFNFKNFDSHSLREDFIERITSLSQNEPFTHLFLTGDILFRNDQADTGTVTFIKKLIEALQLPLENVILVPGNHDHNRDIVINQLNGLPDQKDTTIDALDESFIKSLLEAFDKFDAVYTEVFSSNYYSKHDNPHAVCFYPSMTVIKLNTAWLDTDSGRSQSLRIGRRQLQLLLSAADKDLQESVNVAVGHHPLEELTVSERTNILELFKKHNIGIYLCGHTHRANIQIDRVHDVIEIIAPGGYIDDQGYSVGGYVWGIIDTDISFYKAEIYNWKDGKWCIDSTLPETDDYGIFYFNTSHFPNDTNIVAVDCKTMGGHVPRTQIEESLGIKSFDTHIYCGPYGNPTGFTEETIRDFSDTIFHLSEKGKTVHLYPLAPIPMLLSLGFNLQKNTRIMIHQYDRNAEKWVYKEKADNISVSCESSISDNSILVVSISTSFNIDPQLITATMAGKHYDMVTFTTNRIEPGYPLYIDDVNNVIKTIICKLNPLASKYTEFHLFAAIPAGLAVELGRNMLSSVYKNIYTYQLARGQYTQDIIINEITLQKPSSAIMHYITPDSTGILYIPILGRVPCGPLREAITENEKCLPILESILDRGNYYILVASGDSMIDAGIDEGDYVLVKQQNTAVEGEIVVAMIDGDTTIKRIHYDDINKKYVLCPENAQYTECAYDHVDIQGIAVKVIKNL